jgi:hypothetical protein
MAPIRNTGCNAGVTPVAVYLNIQVASDERLTYRWLTKE